MPPAPTRAPRKTALQQKTGLYLHSYSAYIKGKTVMEINWDQVYMRCKLLWVVPDLRLWIVQAAHFCSSPWNSQLFSKAQRKHDMGRGGGVKGEGTNSSFALYSSRSKTSINSLSYYVKVKNTFFFLQEKRACQSKISTLTSLIKVQCEIQLQKTAIFSWGTATACPILLKSSWLLHLYLQPQRRQRSSSSVCHSALTPEQAEAGTLAGGRGIPQWQPTGRRSPCAPQSTFPVTPGLPQPAIATTATSSLPDPGGNSLPSSLTPPSPPWPSCTKSRVNHERAVPTPAPDRSPAVPASKGLPGRRKCPGDLGCLPPAPGALAGCPPTPSSGGRLSWPPAEGDGTGRGRGRRAARGVSAARGWSHPTCG